MGNKKDLDRGPVFVIAASRSDELKKLFTSPPAESGIAFSGNFDVEPWNYLGNDGFTVKYRHSDTHGEQVLSEINFLYAQDNKVRSLDAKREEEPKNNEVEQTNAPVTDKAEDGNVISLNAKQEIKAANDEPEEDSKVA